VFSGWGCLDDLWRKKQMGHGLGIVSMVLGKRPDIQRDFSMTSRLKDKKMHGYGSGIICAADRGFAWCGGGCAKA
jgi:hypothetical protein